jgi:hypothetical protein
MDIVSEDGRWRSREQATTTTTATREPVAGLTFFVEDMERRQADIGNLFSGGRAVHQRAPRESTDGVNPRLRV